MSILEDRNNEYGANLAMSGEYKLKAGHYLKRGDKIVSNRHDSSDDALKTWNNLPEKDKTGVKIMSIKESKLDHEFVQNELANKDINSSIKDDKLHVHRSNVLAARKHVKHLGYDIPVVAEVREELKTFLDYLNESTKPTEIKE